MARSSALEPIARKSEAGFARTAHLFAFLIERERVAFCHRFEWRDLPKHWTRFRVDSWQDC
ncbi:MAG: hypothetical protein B6A08_15405 [Sorangiineae bacterium NIC37A_2]|nr:MAG: hypothetical protein B6A08_15405 [Sorangiineae bacterium NIC37A_2]